MKNYISLQLLITFIQISLSGQGLILDDETYNKLSRQPVYNEGSKAENEALRNIAKVDLKPYCPTPQHQGFISSCTGWATGYGALTIYHSIQQKWANKQELIDNNAFSALFIYNQIKNGSCDAGSSIDKAARLIQEKGDLLYKEFDKFKNNCNKLPTELELKKANSFKIKDFLTLFYSNENERIKIDKTKLSLYQNKPVIVGMILRKNFEQLNVRNQVWYPEIGDTTFYGAHSMVVIGYDDAKQAFEVMNSWGVSWGNQGFGWIKYKDFGRYCSYGFQFITNNNSLLDQIFETSIQLRTPYYNNKLVLKHRIKDVSFNGRYYEFAEEKLEINTLLQTIINTVTPGSYLYVFSYDTKNNVYVHWPKDQKLDKTFFDKNESPIITVSNINLIIPDEYSAMEFNSQGTEYLCFLISRKPIPDLNKSFDKLKKSKQSDFIENLYSAFNKNLEPIKNIKYQLNSIGFKNPMLKGIAVPLVLKLNIG